MKRCSTCNRTYDDPNLSFCIDARTTPTPVETDDDTTVVRSRNTEENDWSGAPYQPPGSYVHQGSPSPETKRRRAWLWVLGIAGAFILGIAALSIAGAIFAMRSQRRERVRIQINQPQNSTFSTANNI